MTSPPAGHPTTDAAPAVVAGFHRSWRWWALRVLPVAVALGVAVPLLAGRRSELSGAEAALGHLRLSWLLVAVGAEVASIASYVGLQHRLLTSSGVVVGLAPLAGITLAGNAIQNSLPGGAAWSGLFAFRQLRRRGGDTVHLGWTLVAVALVSDAGLATLFVIGLVVAQGRAAAADVATVVAGAAVAALLVGTAVRQGLRRGRGPEMATLAVKLCQRIVRRPRGDVRSMVERATERLRAVHPTRRDWARAYGWAVANWSLDSACLAAAFTAVHSAVPWRGLLLAYGTGQVAANLPITPGGLGVVEGSLSIALVYYGGVRDSTVAAVLVYRIISFWCLLPLGWGSWLLLRLSRRARAVPSGPGAGA